MAYYLLYPFLSFEILSEQMEHLNEITWLQRDIFRLFCDTFQIL